MLNNAVLQFVDRSFLAKESMASIEAALPASMLCFIIAGFFQSIVAYSGTFVAQYHGAGDPRGVRMSYLCGSAIAILSGFAAACFIPLGRAILPMMTSNPEVVSRSSTYYTIVAAGTIALCGQMAASAYFTGQGKTRLVFLVNVIGNLVNVALDPLLIFGKLGFPHLGIAGAAYATVFAMTLQWAILAWCARGAFKAQSGERRTDENSPRSLSLRILKFGIPSGAYSVLNVLSFTVFVFVTGTVGDVEFAVSNACFSVNWLLIAPMEGFAIGASTLVAQAQGRGDAPAARLAMRRALIMGLVTVAILSLCAVVFNRQILSLFAPPDARLSTFYSLGQRLIILMAAWQMFDAADVITAGALKGAGDTRFVAWWMVVAAFFIWLPMVWAVKIWHNTMSALWSTMVAYVIIICAGEIIRWKQGKWEKIHLV